VPHNTVIDAMTAEEVKVLNCLMADAHDSCNMIFLSPSSIPPFKVLVDSVHGAMSACMLHLSRYRHHKEV
jgi:hypothetical protein